MSDKVAAERKVDCLVEAGIEYFFWGAQRCRHGNPQGVVIDLAEGYATEGARDISDFGGWRKYVSLC